MPSPPQYTDLPAGVPFPNPPCHPRSLLPQTVLAYQGNKTSHPGKATGSTDLLFPTILQVPTWLRLLKIGPHNISKFSQCLSVCLSNSFPHFSCKSKELFMIKSVQYLLTSFETEKAHLKPE